MFCHKCGVQVPSGAQFCTRCGTRLLAIPSSASSGQMRQAPPAQVTQTQPIPQQQPPQPQPSAAYATGYSAPIPSSAAPRKFVSDARYAMTDTDRTLRLIAFILNVISSSIFGLAALYGLISLSAAFLYGVPLAWMVPMTIYSWRAYQGQKPNTTTFGVCTLIFCNIIDGILLLVSGKDE